jgi:hypothetical protein
VKWKLSLKLIFLFFFCTCLSVTCAMKVAMCVVVLQECLELLLWLMNNWQFPFLLFASRIFPDKKMESVVKRKL